MNSSSPEISGWITSPFELRQRRKEIMAELERLQITGQAHEYATDHMEDFTDLKQHLSDIEAELREKGEPLE